MKQGSHLCCPLRSADHAAGAGRQLNAQDPASAIPMLSMCVWACQLSDFVFTHWPSLLLRPC